MTQYILDTNYYRIFVFNKNFNVFQREIEKQKEIENKRNIEVVFPIISAIELLNHLNEDNASSRECFKALNLLVRHCGNKSVKGSSEIIVPTFYDLLTMYFFNTTSKNHIYNNNIFLLSQKIGESNGYEILTSIRKEIAQVVSIKKLERNNIISNIEQSYFKSLHPEGKIDWYLFHKNAELKEEFQQLIESKNLHKIIGLSMLNLAMEQVNSDVIKITKSEFENRFLNLDFKVSIDFFVKQIVSKMKGIQKMEYFFKPETDPKKRWNSFYDMQLIFATEYENLNNRKTVFVTRDDKIRKCFSENNKGHLVISIDEYNNLLK